VNDFPYQTRAESRPDRYSRGLVEWKNPQSSLRAQSPLCRGSDFSTVIFSVRATTAGVNRSGTARAENEGGIQWPLAVASSLFVAPSASAPVAANAQR